MTAQTTEIMEVVVSLPIDMKLELVDRLLESISPTKNEIEEHGKMKWREGSTRLKAVRLN